MPLMPSRRPNYPVGKSKSYSSFDVMRSQTDPFHARAGVPMAASVLGDVSDEQELQRKKEVDDLISKYAKSKVLAAPVPDPLPTFRSAAAAAVPLPTAAIVSPPRQPPALSPALSHTSSTILPPPANTSIVSPFPSSADIHPELPSKKLST